jgi:hypothetical protein
MALNDLWKKFIRDEQPAEDENSSYYRPRKKAEAPSLVDEPDDDAFHAPKTRVGAVRMAEGNDYNDLIDEEPAFGQAPAKPRFKRVMVSNIKSAEHAVDLVVQNYIVLVNTEQATDEMLVAVRCYIAGAIRALGAHITALDDENAFVSIAPFDATPYLPAQDETNETEQDLI